MSEPLAAAPLASVALARWQRRLVWSSVTLLAASGAFWLLATHWWVVQGPFGEQPHPSAPWALRLHGVAAYGALLALGSLLPVHIRLAWRLRRNRSTGIAMGVLWSTLVLSGLWLYYGGETGREFISLAHWVPGLALPALLLLHRWTGRRAAAR